MQESEMGSDVFATPGHLINLAARGFARLSEARLKPLGVGSDNALAILPDACVALFRGNRQALDGFTEDEAAQFITLLERLIANLDRLASAGSAAQQP